VTSGHHDLTIAGLARVVFNFFVSGRGLLRQDMAMALARSALKLRTRPGGGPAGATASILLVSQRLPAQWDHTLEFFYADEVRSSQYN